MVVVVGDVLLPPPPQATTSAPASAPTHNRVIHPESFLFLLENGKHTAAARNNEPAARMFVRCNIAAAKCGPFVVMDSIVVTTPPFVVIVAGLKLQADSAGKPEQLNEIELLWLKPVKGVIASRNEADCPAPTVALVAFEEIASEADDVPII